MLLRLLLINLVASLCFKSTLAGKAYVVDIPKPLTFTSCDHVSVDVVVEQKGRQEEWVSDRVMFGIFPRFKR